MTPPAPNEIFTTEQKEVLLLLAGWQCRLIPNEVQPEWYYARPAYYRRWFYSRWFYISGKPAFGHRLFIFEDAWETYETGKPKADTDWYMDDKQLLALPNPFDRAAADTAAPNSNSHK